MLVYDAQRAAVPHRPRKRQETRRVVPGVGTNNELYATLSDKLPALLFFFISLDLWVFATK